MSRVKLAYDGEWVRVRNLMNKHFHAARPCAICRHLSCSVVWYSLRTKEVRCTRCFTPESYSALRAPKPGDKLKDANWISGEECIAEIRKLLDCSREQAIDILRRAAEDGLLPTRKASRPH